MTASEGFRVRMTKRKGLVVTKSEGLGMTRNGGLRVTK
jgi:hypothetical protein